MRFFGDFTAKADAKGRVFLPATFRKVLEVNGEEQLVMRPDLFQKCLVLYPKSLWNQMLDELKSKLSRWNKAHSDILRDFVTGVEDVVLDGSGRFLINKQKLAKAGITSEVQFLAVDDHNEVWDKDTYDAHVEKQQADLGQRLEDAMKDLGF